LEAAMHANGWTTTELARHVDLQPGTIRYLRAGTWGPSPANARAIAQALEVPVAELFPDKATPVETPLAAALAERGLSHSQLARQAGVHVNTISAWATGTASPRADNKAAAVAAVIGTPVEKLFPPTRQDLPLVPAPTTTLTPDQVLATEATHDPKWGQRASCASGEHDPDLWFPETHAQATKARQLCVTCPVVGDCRDAFLDTSVVGLARQEMDRGIWAGLKGSELREAARQQHSERAANGSTRRVVETNREPQTSERTQQRQRRGRVASL